MVATKTKKTANRIRSVLMNGIYQIPLIGKTVWLALHPQDLKDFLHVHREKYRLWKYLKFPLGRKVFIFGVPLHANSGDNAILLAEKMFLESLGFSKEQIKEISLKEYSLCNKKIHQLADRNVLLCYQGGGNMGDLWPSEEAARQRVFSDFPDKKIVCFPQTVYYSPTEDGRQEEERSVAVYNSPHCLLIARDQKSFDKMNELYPLAEKLLTPDMVLSTSAADYGVIPRERKGILLCLRTDKERSLTTLDWETIKESAQRTGEEVRSTDMYSVCNANRQNRFELVREKLREIAGARLVITDRLHGMIFSAITGTPCIVLGNNHYKVRGTYEWIQYLPYVRYAENAERVPVLIPELLTMKDCQYDKLPLQPYFEKIKEISLPGEFRCRK